MKLLLRILALLIGYAGQAQVVSDSLLIEGEYRRFHFHPPSHSLQRPSLVFVMHGSGGTGLGMMKGAAEKEGRATAENALVVYPDGYKKYWNECRKASPAEANRKNINEQAFSEA
jgi:polyhydroxybutyrate depolymerase